MRIEIKPRKRWFTPMVFVMLVFIAGVIGGFCLSSLFRPVEKIASMRIFQGSGKGAFERFFVKSTSEPEFDGVAISMVVLDEEGEVWFASPMADTAMCPASALKILTTGAALEILGPDFRFETKLVSSAPAAPTLDGDLVIVGGGDPVLTSRQLENLVVELTLAGIRRIDGRVIADASRFPEHPMSEHWNWGDIGNAYGAGAFGLNVNHNMASAKFRAGASAGDPAVFLGAGREFPGISWQNLVTTGAVGTGQNVTVFSEPYGSRVTFRGTIPPGTQDHFVSMADPNPPASVQAIVTAALRENGVEITGRVREPSEKRHILARAESVPLIEIVGSIHRTSNNLEAQCLFLMLGMEGDPVAVVREYWESRGVPFSALRMIDGSGLARANMIRAVDLAKAMRLALDGPHGREFFESMPVYQDGMVRSKPGWMSGVTTSVGAITTKDGRRMTYAFMANGVTDRSATVGLRERLRAAVADE